MWSPACCGSSGVPLSMPPGCSRRSPSSAGSAGTVSARPSAPAGAQGGAARARSRPLATPEPDPRRWLALAVVGTAFFMTILDVSIVNVALPTIGKDLNFSRENLQWVVTAYALTFGGFLLLGGRAADLLGRRRVFM